MAAWSHNNNKEQIKSSIKTPQTKNLLSVWINSGEVDHPTGYVCKVFSEFYLPFLPLLIEIVEETGWFVFLLGHYWNLY